MNTLWVIAGLAVIGGLAAIVVSWQHRDEYSELGSVSNQWVAEHRLDPGNDSRR